VRAGAGACVVALAFSLWSPGAATAADSFYSPTVNGIDTVCDAYRPHAKRADVVRLARVGASDAPWTVTDEATNARVQEDPKFAVGDFVTIVVDRGAIVSADSTHVDPSVGHVIVHAWCFIGGKLSRATTDYAPTFDRGVGYRRTRYYGDDLDEPLAETMNERGSVGKTYVAPPKEIDALLVVEPDARPASLPFYDAFELERKGALPRLKGP
jgi:hypothetical protein